jgi:S-adenosylmethionine decarboxylase
LDLYDCDPEVLDDYEELQRLLEASLVMAKATILRIIGEKFQPQGVTLLALLAESHASIHSWPEIGYCAIDLYTCGDTTQTHKVKSKNCRAKRVGAFNYSSSLCIVNRRISD